MRAGETQACADAAAERIQDLEQQADSLAKQRDLEAADAQAALATVQAEHSTQLQTAAAEHIAAIAAVQALLAASKVPLPCPCWLSLLHG